MRRLTLTLLFALTAGEQTRAVVTSGWTQGVYVVRARTGDGHVQAQRLTR